MPSAFKVSESSGSSMTRLKLPLPGVEKMGKIEPEESEQE